MGSSRGRLSLRVTPTSTFEVFLVCTTAFAIVQVVLVVGLFFSPRRHRPHRVPRGMPSTTPAQASCPSGLGLTRLGPTRLDSIGRVLRWDPKAENQRRRNIVCFLSKYINLVQNFARNPPSFAIRLSVVTHRATIASLTVLETHGSYIHPSCRAMYLSQPGPRFGLLTRRLSRSRRRRQRFPAFQPPNRRNSVSSRRTA
ncbi:hypothetical protein CCHR01_18962 [Colletotrichum chrysophilum]|uniref:Uncharacterized protein n=1 Tax=Colletotrichum chrysophilum TaxID=1836956 RepID=A0AAD8ZZI3_9PEZI|nr:hypothetical protein CCHR01_18962 [Colletotrichum chrysophilum]